jgi:methyltransferase-like protein 23
MNYQLVWSPYLINGKKFEIYIPEQEEVRNLYRSKQISFPYWSQVWPSAIALCQFILEHPLVFENRNVLEMAAGLGLPSIVVSSLANKVTCSDHDADAVAIMQKTIERLGLKNCTATQTDLTKIIFPIPADLLMLSDINYDPLLFPSLEITLNNFLKQGTSIILSTPQRLVAKSFIEALSERLISCKEIQVGNVMISIFLLHGNQALEIQI